jgi:hypothetical protein
MSLDFDNANRARDARLRYAVLVTVDSNKHTGYALTGRTIRDIHDGIQAAADHPLRPVAARPVLR